jgi:hypothetical protein
MPRPNDLTTITDEETIADNELSAGEVRWMVLEVWPSSGCAAL